MALSARIFKANVQISDMDRGYYAEHLLTLARHPSETDERMMVRLLAFALHAGDHLSFTKGLSTDEEPDLWQISLSNEIELWIDVGLPDERRLRKACSRAQQVYLYSYGGRGDYVERSQTALREMQRQVGTLAFNAHGLAVRGVLVRHLVLPGGLAGSSTVLNFIARELSQQTWINLMNQYRPCFEAEQHPPLDRRITRSEYKAAMALARHAGLKNLL